MANTEAEILKNIIQNRKSIFPKDYSGEPIPDAVLDEILNSADFAPNHKKTRPWKFMVFRNDEKHHLGQKLASVYKETTSKYTFLEKKYADISHKIKLADAVAVIVVKFSGIVPEWEEIAATAMAVQNMYLTCTANKVGCYWSTPGMKEHLSEFLQLEENEKCFGFFYMGMIANPA